MAECLKAGMGLDFKSSTSGNFGILIGRDITESRRRTMLENETQRMLPSASQHLTVAVVIEQANGVIFIANPAFQAMLGYNANSVVGLNVEGLIAPEYADAARDAHARQLLDSVSYRMKLNAIMRGGKRPPVMLTSVLLKTWKGEPLRAVTLSPDAETRNLVIKNPLAIPQTTRRGVGQIKAVSLAALKAGYGNDWSKIAYHAMMLAEQIIKRQLGSVDLFGRIEDEGFVIWFDSSDEAENEPSF